jgi:hypothetical protein
VKSLFKAVVLSKVGKQGRETRAVVLKKVRKKVRKYGGKKYGVLEKTG